MVRRFGDTERSPGARMLFAALAAMALVIPLFTVYLLVYDRQSQSKTAQASIVQGDAYHLDKTLKGISEPASAVVSGLPLVTKPMLTRLRLIRDAFAKLIPGAPFIQFTYAVVPPIPKSLSGVSTESSERVWMNIPPARVWVYRKG